MYKIESTNESAWSGDASLSVSQNRSYRCGAKASVKITRPLQPLWPRHPTPRPGLLLPTPSVCRRVHVFLSAVSALCCTNCGRLPKVHAMRPRLIIILRRIVDPARPRECRKRRKTKLAYEFGRLRSGNAKSAYFVHVIRDNKCWIHRWKNLMLNFVKSQIVRFKRERLIRFYL